MRVNALATCGRDCGQRRLDRVLEEGAQGAIRSDGPARGKEQEINSRMFASHCEDLGRKIKDDGHDKRSQQDL